MTDCKIADFRDFDWAGIFNANRPSYDQAEPGSDESMANWNAKAASFARKPERSGYIAQLLEMLETAAAVTGLCGSEVAAAIGEGAEETAVSPCSFFDMGCGSGTLSIPLALAGHHVEAVDFSRNMLLELASAAAAVGITVKAGDVECEVILKEAHARLAGNDEEAEVLRRIGTAHRDLCAENLAATFGSIRIWMRSWQDSWDGLPEADIAFSSRSFVTSNMADGIAKLESKARSHVFLTCGAGDLPYRDKRIFAAMGRPNDAQMFPTELACFMNHLFTLDRLPQLRYITYPGIWHRKTRDQLEAAIRETHTPENVWEEKRLAAFLNEHLAYDSTKDWWMMDYPRQDSWAVLDWAIPALHELPAGRL